MRAPTVRRAPDAGHIPACAPSNILDRVRSPLPLRLTSFLLVMLSAVSITGCGANNGNGQQQAAQALASPSGLPATFEVFADAGEKNEASARARSGTTSPAFSDLTALNVEALANTLGNWWTIFDDALLNSLVHRTIESNWELQAAVENIEQAKSEIVRVNSNALPSLGANVTASRQQTGTNSKLGFALYDLYGFNASLAWEPDVFGQVQTRVDAATRNVELEQAERRALMVAITAELVDAYAQLRAVQQQLALTRQYANLLQQQIALTRRLADSGLVAPARIAQMQQVFLSTQSQIPALQARIESLITTCSILTGGFPGELAGALRKPAPMLSVKHAVPKTLPSQVLAQRPDIAAQQARILASLWNVEAAQADFMPRFNIPLGVGFSSTPFDLLLNPASFIWNFGVGLVAPLYTGEKLEANLAIAQSISRQDQLLYEQAVRQALKEVEDAVIGYQMSQASLVSTENMLKAQGATVAQQQSLFATGQASRLQLNQALLEQVLSRQLVIDARYATTANMVMLYRALGGGWTEDSQSNRSERPSTQKTSQPRNPGPPNPSLGDST